MNATNGRYDVKSLSAINSWYHQVNGINQKDVEYINALVQKIEGPLSNKDSKMNPKPGDMVCYTTSEGDYIENARLDFTEKDEYEIWCKPDVPILFVGNDGIFLTNSGGPTETFVEDTLKYVREKKAKFRVHIGLKGELIFYCKVNLWEGTYPYPKYGSYSTKDWAKYAVVQSIDQKETGYLFKLESGSNKRFFDSEIEFQHFVKSRNGEVVEEKPNHFTLWCYKDKVTRLEKYVFDLIKDLEVKSTQTPTGGLLYKETVNEELKSFITLYCENQEEVNLINTRVV